MLGFETIAQVRSSAICLRLGLLVTDSPMSVSGDSGGVEIAGYHRQAGALFGGVA